MVVLNIAVIASDELAGASPSGRPARCYTYVHKENGPKGANSLAHPPRKYPDGLPFLNALSTSQAGIEITTRTPPSAKCWSPSPCRHQARLAG